MLQYTYIPSDFCLLSIPHFFYDIHQLTQHFRTFLPLNKHNTLCSIFHADLSLICKINKYIVMFNTTGLNAMPWRRPIFVFNFPISRSKFQTFASNLCTSNTHLINFTLSLTYLLLLPVIFLLQIIPLVENYWCSVRAYNSFYMFEDRIPIKNRKKIYGIL